MYKVVPRIYFFTKKYKSLFFQSRVLGLCFFVMKFLVDFFEVLVSDMSVDLGGGNGAVS